MRSSICSKENGESVGVCDADCGSCPPSLTGCPRRDCRDPVPAGHPLREVDEVADKMDEVDDDVDEVADEVVLPPLRVAHWRLAFGISKH